MNTTHAAYIEEIFKGSGLFSNIGETATVPLSTPQVANKLTTSILDFASGIEISKNLFDDNMHGVWSKTVADFAMVARVKQLPQVIARLSRKFRKFGETLVIKSIPSQAFAF